MKRRILNVLIALDQFLYVLVTLGHGSPDETMSAAAWRLERSGKIAGRIFRPVLAPSFLRWSATIAGSPTFPRSTENICPMTIS